jgi:hypothetical protein
VAVTRRHCLRAPATRQGRGDRALLRDRHLLRRHHPRRTEKGHHRAGLP